MESSKLENPLDEGVSFGLHVKETQNLDNIDDPLQRQLDQFRVLTVFEQQTDRCKYGTPESF